MRIVAIVPAAGSGKRLKSRIEKPFLKIRSKPLVIHTLKALASSPLVEGIILVVNAKFIKLAKVLLKKYNVTKVIDIVSGGDTRAESVSNGLAVLEDNVRIVLVHDGARPLVDSETIGRAVGACEKHGAACVAVPVKPTIKKVERGIIKATLKRDELWEAQTPQVFKKAILLKAYADKKNLLSATDDAGLAEKAGYKVHIVEGKYRNIKVTSAEDLSIAGNWLK